jgi:hypothetical protein
VKGETLERKRDMPRPPLPSEEEAATEEAHLSAGTLASFPAQATALGQVKLGSK